MEAHAPSYGVRPSGTCGPVLRREHALGWRLAQARFQRLLLFSCTSSNLLPAFGDSLVASPCSFVTTTFVVEAMGAANAQLRWKRVEAHQVCAPPWARLSAGLPSAESGRLSRSPLLTEGGCGTQKSYSLSRVQLCNPVGCSPPGSSVHGILRTGILEWVAISSSRTWTPSGP